MAQSPAPQLIVNQLSAKCLDDTNASLQDGTIIQQWGCNGYGQQNWLFNLNGDGSYTIQNQLSGKCLDDPNGWQQNGIQIQQWDCNGLGQQNWILTPTWGGVFTITNQLSGNVLDMPLQCIGNDGCQLQQWQSNGGEQQQWQVYGTGGYSCSTAFAVIPPVALSIDFWTDDPQADDAVLEWQDLGGGVIEGALDSTGFCFWAGAALATGGPVYETGSFTSPYLDEFGFADSGIRPSLFYPQFGYGAVGFIAFNPTTGDFEWTVATMGLVIDWLEY